MDLDIEKDLDKGMVEKIGYILFITGLSLNKAGKTGSREISSFHSPADQKCVSNGRTDGRTYRSTTKNINNQIVYHGVMGCTDSGYSVNENMDDLPLSR